MSLAVSEASTTQTKVVRCGKYLLIASLGQGGMADVFLAVVQGPAGFSKLQVIKQLRSSLTEEAEFLAMFLDEARLAARLSHRNVVQTNEVGQIDNTYFIAMEYLDGQPLNRILRQCRKTRAPPRGILLRIVADALAGLHYAHELTDYEGKPLNVVHRDASPHNIFVTYEGQTKVVDFGIAKAATRSVETASGLLKGKVSYMAPEQVTTRREIDRRADVFVLGVVLWEVMANRKMWEGGSDMEIIGRIIQGDLPKLRQTCPDAPAPLIDICTRATALDPAQRYTSAAEMRAALLEYLDQSGQRVATEDVGRFVTELFASKRIEFQKAIDRQLSKLTSSTPSTGVDELLVESPSTRLPQLNASIDASAHTPSHQQIPSLAQLVGGESIPPSNQRPSVPSALSTRPSHVAPISMVPPSVEPPRKSSRYQLVAIALTATLATTATLYFTRKEAPVQSSVTAVESTHATGPTESNSPPAPSATTEPARDSEMIELRVEAAPKSAKLFMDGAQLPSNPFSAKFPSDGSGHRIRAEASGYSSQSKIVIFEKDTQLKLDLEQPSATRVTRGRQAAVPSPPPPPPPPAPSPAAPTATPATATTTAAAAKPKRSLDSGNPWASQSPPTATSAPGKPKRQLDNPW